MARSRKNPVADKSKDAKEEATADAPGLIDLVVNEQEAHRVEFWVVTPQGRCNASFRWKTAGSSTTFIPPPRKALPWFLPRRREVERYLGEDTNADYFKAVLEWIQGHVDLPFRYVVLLAAWIVHTYVIDLVYASPYVLLLGPPETGKTRTTATCVHAARRGILTMTPREAALIRYADTFHATIGLDTIDFMTVIKPMADFFASRPYDDGSVTTRILDYSRGPFEGIQHYEPFGATLVTSNRALSDDVVASRTLVIRPSQTSKRFPRATKQLALPLRERGTAFRARVLQAVSRGELPEPPELAPGRLGEIMSGLALAVALTDPSYMDTLQELAGEFAAARRAEVQDTLEVELLRRAIAEVEGANRPVVEMKLIDFVHNANVDWANTGEKLLTSRGVSGTLRTTLGFTLQTGTGNYTYVTLRREQLTTLAGRYGLQPPGEEVKKPASPAGKANAVRVRPSRSVSKRSRPKPLGSLRS